jgi:hypothetical protein
MLLALLLGLALQSATVGAERVAIGIAFSSRTPTSAWCWIVRGTGQS